MDDKQTAPAQTPETEQPAETLTQETAAVNEPNSASQQPANSASTYQVIQPAHTEVKKPSKWRYVFFITTAIQVLGVILFFSVTRDLIKQADAGVAGTEFLFLAMLVTIVPAVGLLALINTIGVPIYLKKQKPHGKALIFWVFSLVVSVPIVLYGLYVMLSLFLVPS